MYHHACIARFHRNNHLVELLLAAYSQELHCRDHHTLWRVTPLVEDALCQRAVVYTYAERNTSFAALCDESLQLTV